jgi:adenylate cyclase, class 2
MKPFYAYPRVMMPVEIEAKMKLGAPDVEPMIARLRDRGAIPLGQYLETNTFFDTEDRALLATDEGLRVRVLKHLTTGDTTAMMTHKGPNLHSQLKRREENEMTVPSLADASRILNCLGYVKCLSFQKRRQSWKLDRCKVEIDELPRLGFFIEIEGPSEEAVMQTRESLGLSESPLIKTPYSAMLTAHLQERGEPPTDLHFPNPDPVLARAS